MTITISQKLIDVGERQDCNKCPAAKAIQEVTGEPARVGPTYILWKSKGVEYNMITPAAVCEFMDRFDAELPVGPISFELEAA